MKDTIYTENNFDWNKLTSKEKLEVAKLQMRVVAMEHKIKNDITPEVLHSNTKEAIKNVDF